MTAWSVREQSLVLEKYVHVTASILPYYRVVDGCFSLLCSSSSSRELNSMPLHILHLNGSSIDITNS